MLQSLSEEALQRFFSDLVSCTQWQRGTQLFTEKSYQEYQHFQSKFLCIQHQKWIENDGTPGTFVHEEHANIK